MLWKAATLVKILLFNLIAVYTNCYVPLAEIEIFGNKY